MQLLLTWQRPSNLSSRDTTILLRHLVSCPEFEGDSGIVILNVDGCSLGNQLLHLVSTENIKVECLHIYPGLDS